MKLSQEALASLSNLDLNNLDLKALEKFPRSVMQELQSLLTPKMTKYIPHVPTAKQSAFMLLDNKEAFYGGAAGGGKSDCLLMSGLQYVDVKGYAGIIFRKNYSDLVKPGALIDRSKEWLFKFNDVRWVEKEKKFEFLRKYGPHTEVWSILQFGYLETDNDRFNYQGGEYQFIGFDELTHISEVCYTYMFSRLRKLKNVKIPLRVRSASNPPDDDQGQWVYDRFVNPEKRRKETIFIPAGLDDNPFLDKEAYIEALNELDPVTRARLKDGLWTVVRKGNQFRREWFEIVDAPPPYRRRVRFWDMASTQDPKKKKKNHDPDYTVGFLLSEAQGIYYIEDIIRVRKRPADTNELQKSTCISDGYKTAVYEEQEPGSSGDATIDMKARTIFKGYNYKGVRSTGSKILRAQAASAAAERGHIKVVRGCRNIEAFFDEAESFPGGLHDDMVDGLSGAFQALANMPNVYVPIQVASDAGSYWDTYGDSIIDDVSGYFSSI
jgi:predicted phage terminase large subunit-like protein